MRTDSCAQFFQMLVYLFYALPLLTVFIYGLKTPGCTWMLDWTIFFAGAMAQVTGNYVFAVVHIPSKSKLQHIESKVGFLLLLWLPLSRLSGAISVHLCTPALPSRTESLQTNGGLLSPSTCCLLRCRLCWPCAATPVPPFL